MIIKRILDVTVSALGIIILFIPFLFIAFIIKITSKGSVFFVQDRVGYKGRIFKIIKFKTMYENSEKHGSITTASDSRVTSIGRILRRYKLDELPQLYNVFVGKMSFVGPRPDVCGYADKLKGEDRKILKLRPGITGPASIYFRNEEELLAKQDNPKEYNDTVIWPQKVKINLDYVERYSFFKDIGYIFITVIPTLDKLFMLVDKIEKKLYEK